MNTANPKNWQKSVQHPSDDDLLRYIDGELSPDLTDDLRVHLEACWNCRNRAEKFQSTISLFIDYRSQVVQPLTEIPNTWGGFNSKLQDIAAATMPPTLWRRLLGTVSRYGASLRAIDIRTARLATISAFTIIFGIAGLYFVLVFSETVVSAEELLNRAAASRENEMRSTAQPVVYQQLRVTRRSSKGEDTTAIEIWQDVNNARMRQVAIRGSGDSYDGPQTVLADLEHILRANNYQPPMLSIVGFRAWRNTLEEKRDSVEEGKTDDGISVLRLSTQVTAPLVAGQVILTTLTVRSRDYHPLEQHFRVKTAEGEQEYQLRETSFAIMSLNSLNHDFFADATSIVAVGKPSQSPAESPGSEPGAIANGSPQSEPGAVATGFPPNAAATAELEVEILDLLHNAGADLGEQIEVKRIPTGPINITGVVETPKRKNQIMTALQSVSANPAVKIQINTVAEELARQKQIKAQPRPSVENIEIESSTFPAEFDVRAHFARQGKDSDQAVRQFATRAIGRSSQAMNYLWAMKRLKGQFSMTEIQKLTPEARAKWLNVIRAHARSYQNEIAALRRELQPLFGGSSGGDGVNIDSDTELLQTVDRLFEAGSGSNQIVRQGFTTNSSQASTNALRTPQFWRLLTQAESLAAAISHYRER